MRSIACGKLGKIVLAAAKTAMSRNRPQHRDTAGAEAKFDWNGPIVAFSTSMGGIAAPTAILSHCPANCAPTIITLQVEPTLADTFIARLEADLKCTVRPARDGTNLKRGCVEVVADPGRHVVIEPGSRRASA